MFVFDSVVAFAIRTKPACLSATWTVALVRGGESCMSAMIYGLNTAFYALHALLYVTDSGVIVI